MTFTSEKERVLSLRLHYSNRIFTPYTFKFLCVSIRTPISEKTSQTSILLDVWLLILLLVLLILVKFQYYISLFYTYMKCLSFYDTFIFNNVTRDNSSSTESSWSLGLILRPRLWRVRTKTFYVNYKKWRVGYKDVIHVYWCVCMYILILFIHSTMYISVDHITDRSICTRHLWSRYTLSKNFFSVYRIQSGFVSPPNSYRF